MLYVNANTSFLAFIIEEICLVPIKVQMRPILALMEKYFFLIEISALQK